MNRYQLAKLVQWAGNLHSRKRLQKVVFLLQAKGCRLDADYTLHHYGPYSQEVAWLSDEMVQVGLLEESKEQNQVGSQFVYSLTLQAVSEMVAFERSAEGRKLAKSLSRFETQAKELLGANLRHLEVASTMVYFRKQGKSWDDSVEKTCKFKKLKPGDRLVKDAEGLAREFIA